MRSRLTTIIILGTLLFATRTYAQTASTVHAERLLDADRSWNGKPYTHYPKGIPHLIMLRITIPPHTALPWHTHPVPNAAYVLEGDITVQDKETGTTRHYTAGQAAAESVDDIHHGISGNKRTVLIVTYAGNESLPTSVPAKGEKKEY